MNHGQIAQSGLDNEIWFAELFNLYTKSPTVKSLMALMGWDLSRHRRVSAYRKGGNGKADVGVDFWRRHNWPDTIYVSCKKIDNSNPNGFGHIHKSTVHSYQTKWRFDDIIKRCLNVFAGNTLHEGKAGLYFEHKYFDPYRLYMSNFFRDNIDTIMNDIFKGRAFDKPSWFAVTIDTGEGSKMLYMLDIEDVIEYAKGDRKVFYGKRSTNQNLCIGNVVMYSRKTDGQLQFKMNYKPMLKALQGKARIFYF